MMWGEEGGGKKRAVYKIFPTKINRLGKQTDIYKFKTFY